MNAERTNISLTTVKQAAKVALFVGSLLLVINQFEAIFGSQNLRWLPALLTYCVPFGVFIAGRASETKRT